ncbi:MAG TPA: hypothetical protein VFT24_07780 [Vicinamibacterales bacterium]|nr:hypothetical protein [Vicinamibacterales bacterium]
MRVRLMSLVMMLAATASLPVSAQEKPAPAPVVVDKVVQSPSRREPPAPIPLKVTVVLSRYQGEKRVSSMPYSMGVTASGWGPAPKSTLRMGVDVPVMMTVIGATDGKATAGTSYNYRNVGTNIDCQASFESTAAGVFQLALTISDSSIGLDTSKKADAPGVVPDVPSFRNFNSSFTALLRDGQTTQYTSATDPVTGELMKIDVTLNVMK